MSGKTILLVVCVAAVGMVLTGCGGGGGSSIVPPPTTGTGSVMVRVDFSSTKSRAIPSATKTVFVTVTGGDLSPALSAVLTPSNPSATFSQVPVGIKIVRADAFDGVAPSPLPAGTTSFGNLLASGFTDVTVTKDSTASADVTVNGVATNSVQFTGTKVINGVTVSVQQDSSGVQRFFSEDNQGLKFHGVQLSATAPQLLFDPPVMIPNGLTTGDTFSLTCNIFVSGSPQGQVNVVVKNHGVEGVMVPGGAFEGDVPHVSITYQPVSPTATPPGTPSPFTSLFRIQRQNLWFGSGIGPVMLRDDFFDPTQKPVLSVYTGSKTLAAVWKNRRALRTFDAATFFPLTTGKILNYAILNAMI